MLVMQSSSASLNYTVTGLQPYQLVAVQISASTSAGEGPLSEVVEGRAREQGMFTENIKHTSGMLQKKKLASQYEVLLILFNIINYLTSKI